MPARSPSFHSIRKLGPRRSPRPRDFNPRRLWRLTVALLTAINYSLPVQLLYNQLKHHITLLMFWVLLVLLFTQNALKALGAPYLFLEPEYHDTFDLTSMFLLGVSFGIYTLAYQMTCYITDGHRFFFIVAERNPFIKFSLNNSILPLTFWGMYIYTFVGFQSHNADMYVELILLRVAALVAGGVLVSVLAALYFSLTDQDIFKLIGKRLVHDITAGRIILREARRSMGLYQRVDYYLVGLWEVRAVPRRMDADFRSVVRILNQNHGNAIVAQTGLLILLVVLGVFQDYTVMQIPAGAGFMLLFAFFVMLIGAISFWMRRVGVLAVLGLIGVLYFVNSYPPFVGVNAAFGLDYDKPPVAYGPKELNAVVTDSLCGVDSARTVTMLEGWKARYEAQYHRKPRLVLLCVSGGGTRSATWTLRCLQYADEALEGRLNAQLGFITGASGGSIGAAYYRELMFRKLTEPSLNLYDTMFIERVSNDLLNPIIFNMTTNLMFPTRKFTEHGHEYGKDRGYAFERRLVENLGVFADRRLGDYKAAEAGGRIPMLVLAPTIATDGRQLFIASNPVSYLCRPTRFNAAFQTEVNGAEFQRLFASHGADSLRFTSALRMNATFPTILPFVELPTTPDIDIMDAGVADNFGKYAAVRFLYHFRDWINANTSGVVLLQIRDTEQIQPIRPEAKRTMLSKMGSMLGGTYNSFAESKDFADDDLLQYAQTWFGDRFEALSFEYIPKRRFEEASLSFHLTRREKIDIITSIEMEENRRTLKRLAELL